jgi:hypothetical protein
LASPPRAALAKSTFGHNDTTPLIHGRRLGVAIDPVW